MPLTLTRTPTPSRAPGARDARTLALEAAIRRHGGHFEREIVREARRHKLPISLVCALIQQESSFRNVYGRDRVSNPIKSPPPPRVLHVTKENYKRYLRFRRQGLGNQGVGPAQLTSPGFQDRADELGGAWKPGLNIRVGCEILAGHIRSFGLRDGLAAYNAGPGGRHGKVGQAYASSVLGFQRQWKRRLAVVGNAPPPPRPKPPAHAPRTFRVRAQPMTGDDVRAFQQLLNFRFREWAINRRVRVDGIYGTDTRLAARQVALGLGYKTAEYKRGITPELRVKIRRPSRRTPQEKARALERRPWLRKLRQRHAFLMSPGGLAYPLARRGIPNGEPFQGTHTRGNWQSDNAQDMNIPIGTPVIAVADGTITKVFSGGSGATAGIQVTLVGENNAWFYGHLRSVSVKPGQRVRQGQVIGKSGSANGVAHLHIGQRAGRPRFN